MLNQLKMKIIWLWDLAFEKTQIGLLNINFPKLSSCMYLTLKLQKQRLPAAFQPKIKVLHEWFFIQRMLMKFALCWDTMGGSSWQMTRSAAASPPFLRSLQWCCGVTSVHIPNLCCTKLSWHLHGLSPADKLCRSQPAWKTEGIFSDKHAEEHLKRFDQTI